MLSQSAALRWQHLAILFACQACTSAPSGMGAPNGASSGTTGVSGGAGVTSGSGGSPQTVNPTPAQCASTTAIMPGQSPVRRLNRFEYNNTVSDLLQDNTSPADSFPLEEQSAFDNDANVLRASRQLVEGYLGAAETLANAALAKPDTLPCAATAGSADTATATSTGQKRRGQIELIATMASLSARQNPGTLTESWQ